MHSELNKLSIASLRSLENAFKSGNLGYKLDTMMKEFFKVDLQELETRKVVLTEAERSIEQSLLYILINEFAVEKGDCNTKALEQEITKRINDLVGADQDMDDITNAFSQTAV